MLLPQGVGALLTRTAAGKLTDAHGGRVVATGGFLACVITTIPFLFLGNSMPASCCTSFCLSGACPSAC